jgi:hypothetical protein
MTDRHLAANPSERSGALESAINVIEGLTVILCVARFMVVLDATIVNVALVASISLWDGTITESDSAVDLRRPISCASKTASRPSTGTPSTTYACTSRSGSSRPIGSSLGSSQVLVFAFV